MSHGQTSGQPQINQSELIEERPTQSLFYSLADLISCVAEGSLATNHLHHLLVPVKQLKSKKCYQKRSHFHYISLKFVTEVFFNNRLSRMLRQSSLLKRRQHKTSVNRDDSYWQAWIGWIRIPGDRKEGGGRREKTWMSLINYFPKSMLTFVVIQYTVQNSAMGTWSLKSCSSHLRTFRRSGCIVIYDWRPPPHIWLDICSSTYATAPIWISLYMRKIHFLFYQCASLDSFVSEAAMIEPWIIACIVHNCPDFAQEYLKRHTFSLVELLSTVVKFSINTIFLRNLQEQHNHLTCRAQPRSPNRFRCCW